MKKFNINEEMKEYLAEVNKYPLLSHDEEKMLATQIALGDTKAREKLINSNLRLVVRPAIKYANCSGKFLTGMNFKDLIQEGNIGLMTAAEMYDGKFNVRFASYAMHWIKQKMIKSLMQQNRAIRLPIRLTTTMLKYNNTIDELTAQYSRKPTEEEIATFMGTKPEKLYEVQMASQDIESLDHIVDDDEGLTIADNVLDEKTSTVQTAIESKISTEEFLLRMGNHLNDRERKVICERFGIGKGNIQKSLQEVSMGLNVSHETVRKIELSAINKLKRLDMTWDKKAMAQKYIKPQPTIQDSQKQMINQ
ncbi:MAG: RNA polymerase sigma factor RpoD/SigA [Christensenellaceae bacterium]|jgi:RNA polymerase primary sigma factor|nr:RNA polymerase sigma factor RpoD/SigA [Christensenellaceae bacterium]